MTETRDSRPNRRGKDFQRINTDPVLQETAWVVGLLFVVLGGRLVFGKEFFNGLDQLGNGGDMMERTYNRTRKDHLSSS